MASLSRDVIVETRQECDETKKRRETRKISTPELGKRPPKMRQRPQQYLDNKIIINNDYDKYKVY
jgi:hypothetical protein